MSTSAATLHEARFLYEDLGFDTIPLRASTKLPAISGWQRRPPAEMWSEAPNDANVGVRCGGESQVAVIDADEDKRPGSVERVQRFLAGLGYLPGDTPVIATASGIGRHFYASVEDPPAGHFRVLSDDFGAGEFRYGPGAYVVAPPSVVSRNGVYRLVNGDFRQLPALAWADVAPILDKPKRQQKQTSGRKRIPRQALAMLNGKYVDNFRSRSEAEQSILTSLINAGFSFEQVCKLFLEFPGAGKFQEMHSEDPTDAVRWLRLSFARAQDWVEGGDSEAWQQARQEARAAIHWANSRPWPGRTGQYDRAVFLAHAKIALRAGRQVYAASVRELAEKAGVHRDTAAAATQRLLADGLLRREREAVANLAAKYSIAEACRHSSDTSPQVGCGEVSELCPSAGHDAFRHGALNKSGAEVWAMLNKGPATVEELVEGTGRHPKTVERALERMRNLVDVTTGEILDMVGFDGQHWHALDVDLDQVARLVGSAGTGRQQRRRHEKEREIHRRALEHLKRKQEQANDEKA